MTLSEIIQKATQQAYDLGYSARMNEIISRQQSGDIGEYFQEIADEKKRRFHAMREFFVPYPE